MKALVTGANGFIGAALVRELVERGYGVRALVRRTSDLRTLEGMPVEIVQGDVLDLPAFRDAARGCDVLFHTAGVFAYWGHAEDDLLQLSVVGAQNAVEAAALGGVSRVVLTSSSVIFGSTRRPVWRDEQCELRDPYPPAYIRAKAAQACAAFEVATERSVDLVAVCPTMVLGERDYRLVPSNRLIVAYLEDAFKATFPGGCNLVHVRDVARGHALVAERGESGASYLLGSENWEWWRIHRTISQLCGIPGPLLTATHTSASLVAVAAELSAQLTGRTPSVTRAQARMVGRYYWYDHARASSLGYHPRPARQALADAIAWLMKSGHISVDLRQRLNPTAEVFASMARV